MKIIDCKQRSPEWYAARCGKVTASWFSAVMAKGQGKTRKTYMYKVLAEKISGVSMIEKFSSKSMDRGTEIEDQARANYELSQGSDLYQQVGFVYHNENIGCSPDAICRHGLSGDDLFGIAGGVEIKCPDSHTHIEYLLKGYPSIYKAQIQGNMWICCSHWWDFVSYDDRVKTKELYIQRIYRDDEYIKNLETEVYLFVEELLELEYRLKNGTTKQLEDSIKAIEAEKERNNK